MEIVFTWGRDRHIVESRLRKREREKLLLCQLKLSLFQVQKQKAAKRLQNNLNEGKLHLCYREEESKRANEKSES